MVEVKFRIDNVYGDGQEVTTYPVATIPMPPEDRDSEEYDEWRTEHVYSWTGTGRTDGDAAYFVEIIESSVPGLIGMEFEFGV